MLDRSAFYPGGGGQPPDDGVLLWGGVQTRIAGARKTGDDVYLIPADGEPVPPAGTTVQGALDDDRRTALMRTHSALHLLAGVVFRDFGALVTGGNMEPLEARMDFNLPEVPEGFKDSIAAACAVEIAADRRIDVKVLPHDEAFAIPDIIRTATDLLPPDLTEVRIVDIVGLDTQADGGTHVASTKQIGGIEIVKIENKGKGFRRLAGAAAAVTCRAVRSRGTARRRCPTSCRRCSPHSGRRRQPARPRGHRAGGRDARRRHGAGRRCERTPMRRRICRRWRARS